MVQTRDILGKVKDNYTIVIVVFTLFITILITGSYNKYLTHEKESYKKIVNNIYFKKTIEYFLDDLNPKYTDKNYKIQPGDSLQKILINHKITKNEIKLIQKKISEKNKKINLKVGQEINFKLENSSNNQRKINSLLIPLSKTHKVQIKKILKRVNSY
tara:strand:- start:44 stop:517 length:474 start_codon:yes stop_codon:yes gene_type:complete